jgi:hypothetical protein
MDNQNSHNWKTTVFVLVAFVVLALAGWYFYSNFGESMGEKSAVTQKMLMVPISEASISSQTDSSGQVKMVKDTVSYEVNKPITEVWSFYKNLINSDGWVRLPMSGNFIMPTKNQTTAVLMEALNGTKDIIISLTPHGDVTEVKMAVMSSGK